MGNSQQKCVAVEFESITWDKVLIKAFAVGVMPTLIAYAGYKFFGHDVNLTSFAPSNEMFVVYARASGIAFFIETAIYTISRAATNVRYQHWHKVIEKMYFESWIAVRDVYILVAGFFISSSFILWLEGGQEGLSVLILLLAVIFIVFLPVVDKVFLAMNKLIKNHFLPSNK